MQLSYSNAPSAAYEGMIAEAGGNRIVSRIASSHQLTNVLVVNAVNSAIYKLHLNDGVNAAADATYTADGSATKAEIVAGLVAAANLLGLNIHAAAFDSDELTLDSLSADAGFSVSSTGDTPSDLTLSVLVAQDQQIPFGRVVVLDEKRGDDFVRLPRVVGDIGSLSVGIAPANNAQAPNDAAGYPDSKALPVVEEGVVWMRTEDACAFGGAVYVRYAANGANDQLGAVRATDDGAYTAPLARATFVSTAGAGELAKVKLTR